MLLCSSLFQKKKRYTHTSYSHIHHRVLIVSSTPPIKEFFFWPILQCNKIGDLLQEDLTKFGYTQDMKIENF
jgi:hypothetical protein